MTYKYSYKVTYILGKMDSSTNPPAFIPLVFPLLGEDKQACIELDDSKCVVYTNIKQTPVKITDLMLIEETENQA